MAFPEMFLLERLTQKHISRNLVSFTVWKLNYLGLMAFVSPTVP